MSEDLRIEIPSVVREIIKILDLLEYQEIWHLKIHMVNT